MKLKNGFIVTQIAGSTVALPPKEKDKEDKMITLNGTAAFLWELLKNETTEEQLAEALMKEYDVSAEQAKNDIAEFVAVLKKNEFLA